MIYCMVYYAYFTQSRYAEVHVSGLKIYGYNARILFFFFLWWPNLHFGSQSYQCCTHFVIMHLLPKYNASRTICHGVWCSLLFGLITWMVIENRVSVLMCRAKKVVDTALPLHLRFWGEGVNRTRECQNVTFEPCSIIFCGE